MSTQEQNTTNYIRNVILEMLKAASNTPALKSATEISKIVFNLGEATLEENPQVAALAVLLAAAAIVIIGPEAIAASALAGLIAAGFGAEFGAAVATVVIEKTIEFAVKQDVQFLQNFLRLGVASQGGQIIGPFPVAGSVTIFPDTFGSGPKYLTLNGTNSSVWGLPPHNLGADSGVLHVRLLSGDNADGTRDFITLEKDAWSSFGNSDGGRTIHLNDGNTPVGQLFWSLGLEPANTVKFEGEDSTSFKLEKPKQLDIFTVGSAAPGSGGTKIRLGDRSVSEAKQIVVNSSGSDTILDSNIGGLTISMGAGTDTLLHTGANSVIDVGGQAASGSRDKNQNNFELKVLQDALKIGPADGDTISLKDFVRSESDSLSGSNGSTRLVVVNGDGKTASGDRSGDILMAAGQGDTLTGSASNVTLVALGKSNDTVIGGSGSGGSGSGGTNRLIAAAGSAVAGAPAADSGADTLVAGGGNNIMVGDGVDTTFKIDASQSTSAIDVVWAFQGKDTLDITGASGLNILEVNDPNATLPSVANLDVQALYQTLLQRTGFMDPKSALSPHIQNPPVPNVPTIIVINGSGLQSLKINGQQLSAANAEFDSGSLPGLQGEKTTENFVHFDPDVGAAQRDQGFFGSGKYWILGFTQGDFGMKGVPLLSDAFTNIKDFVGNGTPTVNLQQFKQGGSGGGGGGSGGSDPSVVDVPTVFGPDVSDTLLSINAASAFGFNDTLIGANGNDSLTAFGSNDTLIAVTGASSLTAHGFNDTLVGDAAGSSLNASSGFGTTVAAYAIDNVAVDLDAGTATLNGSSVSDTIFGGIATAIVSGSNDTLSGFGFSNLTLTASGHSDTLIGLGGRTTLLGNTHGNTLIDQGGGAKAAYALDNVTVNLLTGTAHVSGSSLSDTLIGITSAAALGQHDIVIAGSGAETLFANGLGDTLIGNGQGDTLSSGSPSGFGFTENTLIGGSGTDTLLSGGFDDSLVAGTGRDLLSSSGFFNTLFGNAAGSTLDGTSGFATMAVYAIDNVTVDLTARTATVNGASVVDTLLGITTVAAFGHNDTLIAGTGRSTLIAGGANDTLIAGSGTTTLISNAGGNTLLAGTGTTVAAYAIKNLTVDLATGTASLNGSTVSDTLVGITVATVSGQQDTLIGGNGTDTLTSTGFNNTLIAGSGTDTLFAGTGDTLIGANGSDVLSSNGSNNLLLAGSGADTLSSAGRNDTLIGDGGGATLSSSGTGNTLIGGSGTDTLSSSGSNDTLVAGNGSDTLSSSGLGNTLFGNAAGSTLDGTAGTGTVAAYALDNVTVDLAAGTARLAGASVSDALIGITTAAAFGSNDTLIGTTGSSTLISNAAGNSLVAGSGATTAAYALDAVTVDLAAQTARLSGSSVSDTLVGVVAATVSGHHDTIRAGSGTDTLSSSGNSNTLIGGSGPDTLSSSGTGDTLLAGSGSNLLSSSGHGNTLVAGGGANTLVSSGTNDTLIGAAAGSTLDGSAGIGTVAAYAIDNVTVNLATATSRLNGTSVGDTLLGIGAIAALGSSDTLIGGAGSSTLISNAAGNTLVGGTGATVAAYALDGVTVDLSVGIARLNGAIAFDTLDGISAALVAGSNDTAIGGNGTDTLTSTGSNNTLIAGSGIDSLSSSGTNDTLFGNARGSTLQQSFSSSGSSGPVIAAYALDNVTIDLSAGTAGINGSGVSDQLVNISVAAALGHNDTLIGASFGNSTLISNASGNTLMAGSGVPTAAYSVDDLTVDMLTGTAIVNGASVGDTLVGIMAVSVSGRDDTFISGGTGNTLTGDASTVLLYAKDNLAVRLQAGTAGVNGTNASDHLSGIAIVTVSGNDDTLAGGFGNNTLVGSGANDTLIAGVGASSLTVSGANDMLIGDVSGSILRATPTATGAVARYEFDDVTVDLASGVVTSPNSRASDSLIGFSAAVVTGNFDTLLGGSGAQTLSATGSADTLIAGSGADTLSSSGTNDVLSGAGGPDILRSSGQGNTLIAGTGIGTLISTGTADTLVGNAGGSTLDGSGGVGTVAVYRLDNMTVDLAAGTARVNGSSVSDTLIGISAAIVSGQHDTLIGNNGTDVLTSNGQGNTVMAGSGTDTLTTSGTGDTLPGGSGADVLTSGGHGNTLVAGSGANTLTTSGTGDTLIGGSGADNLSSTGQGNTLMAGLGTDTLTTSGAGDTLFGNAVGSTLDGSAGSGAVAAYSIANVAVDLATGTASLNGSSAGDTLIGISTAAALGGNDTLIGGAGVSTLLSNAGGNTLVAGTGQTVAVYRLDNAAVDLANGTAKVNGASVSDTLVGITTAVVSGTGDTLTGGSGADVLSSRGVSNTLIAGSGIDTLASGGTADTLFGNAVGSTLDGTAGTGAVAAYSINSVTVDLATGTASVNGSGVDDLLLGISTAAALGGNDTLIGGPVSTTLISNAGGNTLIAGSGQTTAAYTLDHVTVDLAVGTAAVNSASASDTLVGINAVLASGTNDTLRAGSGMDVLSSNGSTNTLIAGSGVDTLVSIGSDDALVGNANGSTLDGSAGIGTVAVYAIDNVAVDLAAGAASLNGSSVSDTLIGIAAVSALGSNDTLIGGTNSTTLISDAAGNTLRSGTGQTTAAFTLDNVAVDLASGTAAVNGSGVSDVLVGINDAIVSGIGDTLIGNSGTDSLTADGFSDTLIAHGVGDVLFSNANGNTLDGRAGIATTAAYAVANVAVDLSAGTATVNGSSVSDTLIGITTVSALGGRDTLTGGAGSTTLIGDAGGNTLVAGTGATTAAYAGDNIAVDLSAGTAVLNGLSAGDTLVGFTIAAVSGAGNTLIAGSGIDTLTASGVDDTLFGNAGGSTLIGTAATRAVAAYSVNNVTIDLATGTAGVNGSSTNDTLIGITVAAASGANDTLIGGTGSTTLIGDLGGNALIAGTGRTTALYSHDNATIDLGAGTASVNGSSVRDTLIGITAVAVSGSHDTVIAGSGADALSSGGTGNTLIAGSGADTLSSSGSGDTLIGNAAGSTLDAGAGLGTVAAYSLDDVSVDLAASAAAINGSGVSDHLTGISTAVVSGSHDTLTAGSGLDILFASGTDDTLFGNAAGSTLDGTAGHGAVAAYASDNVRVNLSIGSAARIGSAVSDTLAGFHDAIVSGAGDILIGDGAKDVLSAAGRDDTLVAESGLDTLFSNANGNTLDGSAGIGVVAAYAGDNVAVDLVAGTASVNGSSASDKLIGIRAADASGSNDTLISDGSGNTLIAGSGSVLASYAASNLVVDLAAGRALVNGSSSSDKLVGVGAAVVSGNNDTINAGAGADTLIARGSDDSLIGNASGATLDGTAGTRIIAVYARNDVTVDLAGDTAHVNGASVSDTLLGIATVAVFGSADTLVAGAAPSVLIAGAAGDTLIDGSGLSTLISGSAGDTLFNRTGSTTLLSNAGGNTLIGTAGQTVAAYARDHLVVDLATGTANVNGSSISDTLVGITAAMVSGKSDTLIGGGGIDTLVSSGAHNTLVAGSGTDTLASSGMGDSLIAGTGADILRSSGLSNTLFGNAAGSTLDGTSGFGTVAAYAIDNVTVDLSAGTASVNGTGVGDTLLGISDAVVSGGNDTVTAGGGADVLASSGHGNTLIAAAGADTLSSSGTGDTLLAGSGLDVLISSGHGNSLVAGSGTDILSSSGTGDTLIGGRGTDTLRSSGSGNTLIAGDGTDTLTSSGTGDTLLGGGGSDVLTSNGHGNTLIAGSAADTLSTSGTSDTLVAGTGSEILSSSGHNNTLIAGSGASTLSSSGTGDTLLGGTGLETLTSTGSANTLIAGGGTDNLSSSGVNDVLTGGSGADILRSSGQGNTLIAGTGIDMLTSSGTNDTLVGNAGGSTLDGSAGVATVALYTLDNMTVDLATGTARVNGSSVSDTLIGIAAAIVSGHHDTLIGANGTDVLASNGQSNTLIAGSGTDTLTTSGTGDTLLGASGADVLTSSGHGNTLMAGSGTNTLSTRGTGDTLVSGSGTETLTTSGTLDTLLGGSGTDILSSNNGQNNVLMAGSGVNTLTTSGGSDTLIGGDGADTLSSIGFGNTLMAGSGADVLLTRGADDKLFGGAGADTLTSNGSSNSLIAGSGNDILSSAGAFDTLMGGSGTDTLTSSGFLNRLIAGSGINTLTTSGFEDVLIGGSGADVLTASGTLDTLTAGSGTATLSATGSIDTLIGGTGVSTLIGNANGTTLIAGTGPTTAAYALDNVTVDLANGTASVNGSFGSDSLSGIVSAVVSGNSDTLIGTASGGVLSASGSNDIVRGGAGNDTLVINGGPDTFFGGGGNDTFEVISAAVTAGLDQPQNLIGDFDPTNPNETIDLTHVSGVASFADLSFSTVTFGGQSFLQIALGQTGQALMLAGVSADQLSAGNFVFAAASAATPPTLSVHDAGGTEGQPIVLDISAAETDAHGSLSLTISGIPADATSSNSNHDTLTAANGSIAFTPAQLAAGVLDGLAIAPTSVDEPSFALHVTATTTDGASIASSSHDLNVTVAPQADAPILTAQNASGTEDQPIALSISSALAESGAADPDTSLSLTIGGIPADAALSNSQGVLTPSNGSIAFTAAQLAAGALTGLAITPTSADEPSFALHVGATATDGTSVASTSRDVNVTVSPMAGAPVLAAADATAALSSVNEDGTVGLTITPHFEANDPDGTNTVTIAGVPVGASLNQGTLNPDGSYTLTAAQLSGLTLHAADDDTTSITLSVQAHASDGSTAADSAIQTIALNVSPVAEAPTVLAGPGSGSVSGGEDQPIALAISVPTLAEADADASVSLTISGIPADASLGNGNHDTLTVTSGSITFTSAQLAAGVLNGLAVTPTTANEPGFTLQVTGTTTDATSSASTSTDLAVAIVPVADAPALTVQNGAGTEDQPIALAISVALLESGSADQDASLSLAISGIPADATLRNSQGALTFANGSIGFSAAQLAAGALSGLAITPTSADGSSFALQVTATAADGSSTASTSQNLTVSVAPHADAPVLTAGGATAASPSVIEDGTVALAITPHFDADPDAVDTVAITGLPAGASLNQGTRNPNGSYTLTADQLVGLTLHAPDSDAASITLHVTAHAAEGGATATSATQTITVAVNPAADAPVLAPADARAAAASVKEAGTVGLIITPDFEADQDATNSVTIVGVPAGASLNHGTLNPDGSYTLTAAQLAGLALLAGDDDTASITLSVQAHSGEGGTGADSAVETITLPVVPVATAPTLSVAAATGNEETPIALDIASTPTEVDPDAALSIRIAGVPAGASLNQGTRNANGTYTLTPAQLAGLALTSDGEVQHFDLTVTATVTDGGSSATAASIAAALHVDVTPVVDAPVLNATDATAASSSMTEDSAVALHITAHFEADADATDTITIAGLPAGASITDGHGNRYTGDSVAITQANVASGLTLHAPDDDTASIALAVQAHSSEGGTAADSAVQTIAVAVNPRADAPALAAADVTAAAPSVNEGGAVAITIAPHFETDPDATDTIVIAGLPSGATFTNAGGESFNGGATLTLSPAQLAGLTLHAADDDRASIRLTVHAHAVEGGGAGVSSASQNLTIAINPVPDAPGLNASDVSAGSTVLAAGSSTALRITPHYATDADAAATVTIAGLPADASLTNAHGGTFAGGAGITLSAAQLGGLTLHAGADAPGFTLAVQAHAGEGTTTADSTTQTISFSVGQMVQAMASFSVGAGGGGQMPIAPPASDPSAWGTISAGSWHHA